MLLEDYFNLDLLLYLRDYFIDIASYEKDEMQENGIIRFLRKENHRSWRNFLSTHKSSPWRIFRRNLSIWNLNSFNSLKFLEDENYRNRLLKVISNPKKQLELSIKSLPQPRTPVVIRGVKVINIIGSNIRKCIHHLNIEDVEQVFISRLTIKELHLGEGIQKLYLLNADRIDDLILKSQLNVDELFYLYNENFSKQFAFDSLRKLELEGIVKLEGIQFIDSVFPHLIELKLDAHGKNFYDYEVDEIAILPTIELSHLEILHLTRIILKDISRCISLRSLSLKDSLIKGDLHLILEKITDFSYQNRTMKFKPHEFIESNRFHRLSLDCENTNPIKWEKRPIEAITFRIYGCMTISHLFIGKNMKNLTIGCPWMKSIELVDPKQQFSHVNLSNANFPNYSLFANTTILELESCLTLRDISPFINIPYLNLSGCENIQDFQFLGKQKYLNLSGISKLSNEDLEYCKNIYHLSIQLCHNITSLEKLMNNVMIDASYCSNLISTQLHGNSYEIVKVRDCQKLKQFSFTTKTDGFRLIHLDISFTLLTGNDFLHVVDFVQQDPKPL